MCVWSVCVCICVHLHYANGSFRPSAAANSTYGLNQHFSGEDENKHIYIAIYNVSTLWTD